jgi:hypothetical protein
MFFVKSVGKFVKFTKGQIKRIKKRRERDGGGCKGNCDK